jgi:cellulose synthase/poly-beta-1,6-N-acetylglucosamine synthase-like glycosyltransferase
LFDYPKPKKQYSVSVITPAYNEEDSIAGTIKSIFNSSYKIKEVIVVNDFSKDKTSEIVKNLMKIYPRLKLINNEKNLGKAESLNVGIKEATSELIAVIDSDSYPDKDSIGRMVGFFNDEKVGAVTSAVLVRHKDRFIEKLQSFEYSIIAWTRKLLSYIEGVWATPGPLSLYRRELLLRLGGFDKNNLTEDIEITWRIISQGYRAEMALGSRVYSIAPKRTSIWIKQRVRWNIGGLQCISKYKKLFLKKGMLGLFILPFFTISLLLGMVGLGVFFYISTSRIIQTFFYVDYTSRVGTSLFYVENTSLGLTILNLYGIIIFFFGLIFTFFGLGLMGEDRKGFRNLFNVLYYIIFYLAVYPGIMLLAIGKIIKYKILRKKIGWGTK